jgi:hypothetical protein
MKSIIPQDVPLAARIGLPRNIGSAFVCSRLICFSFLRINLANIVVMAGAWHGGVEGGGQYIKDAALQDAIFNAMDYWFSRDIGTNVACLNLGGTSACSCSNPEDTLW